MKKFSGITGVQVSQELKSEIKNINEEEVFKSKILNLLDQFLTIRTYGPIDRYLRAGNIKIEGKELFLEALMDVLKDKSSNDEKKILESLKLVIKDWDIIDSKIVDIDKKINQIQEKNKILPYIKKIQSAYRKYGSDEEIFLKLVRESCDKITDINSLQLRCSAVEYLLSENKYPKDLITKVYELYKNRLNLIS